MAHNLKYFILIFSVSLINVSCDSSKSKKPKIAIAGLAIESSTFSPAVTEVEAFLAREGEAVFDYYPFLQVDQPQRKAANWAPTLRGHSLPGGIVSKKHTIHLLERHLKC